VSVDRIRRVLAAKAQRHPELARPLTWNTLRRVLKAEDVALVVADIRKPARLVGFDGLWTIAVSSRHPARRHTYYAAHEIGHLWLHVDDADGRHVRCFNFDDYDSPDPREEEAETVATWLLGDRQVRSFLGVDTAPAATLAPPNVSLLDALAAKKVVRAAEITPREPEPRPLAKPERADELARQIEQADSLAELAQLRARVYMELANDARQRSVLRQLDAREDELLDLLVYPTRRR